MILLPEYANSLFTTSKFCYSFILIIFTLTYMRGYSIMSLICFSMVIKFLNHILYRSFVICIPPFEGYLFTSFAHLKIFLLPLFLGGESCVYHKAHRGQIAKNDSLLAACPGVGTHIVRADGRCLYLLSPLTKLFLAYFKNWTVFSLLSLMTSLSWIWVHYPVYGLQEFTLVP